jgi:DNA-binding CsgD family transcriptional regulator
MFDSVTESFDATRLLFDLQQANELAQACAGCLEPEAIARRITSGLVEKFDCAFARLWLLEPDQTALRLVASSGMYTHLNGRFARVPMGAYKVGKIAQNRVSFLSNNLPTEPWVGDRDWAIANHIRGFAGYPLALKERVIGVLAIFSQQMLQPEFLEALQTLCTIVTIALDTAIHYQKERQIWQVSTQGSTCDSGFLSDQLAEMLPSARLTLVGTEYPLALPIADVFLESAARLNRIACTYCRLIYTDTAVVLEAIVPTPGQGLNSSPRHWIESSLGHLPFTISCLGGEVQVQPSGNQRAIQVALKLPSTRAASSAVQIRCRLPLLQTAFQHLTLAAGLTIHRDSDEEVPLLTDDLAQLHTSKRVLWIHQGTQPLPKGIKAKIDLSIRPDELRQAVAAVNAGQCWGIGSEFDRQPALSERELEVLLLLTQGLRDRDIANQLIISESTVKFHMNNVLTKLKARTRYQAIHQAIACGWL